MSIYENLVNLFGESQRNAIAIIKGDKAYVYTNFKMLLQYYIFTK